MFILVTGANGQLGKELVQLLIKHHLVIGLTKQDLDITNKLEVYQKIISLKPEIIIHTAAYTAVDQCELEPKKAMDTNVLGTCYISSAAKQVDAKVIYISTDYVFDGTKKLPYIEEDLPNPKTVYGLSKWLGEEIVLFNSGIVIRTSWLFGHYGDNFVRTILKLASRNHDIKVVNDQIGTPTYVNDLTKTIEMLLTKESGIYHVSNSGSCSWYEFARTIFEEAGFSTDLIVPISTEEFGSKASRPKFSVLENSKLSTEDTFHLRNWKDALKDYLRKESLFK